jgi:hypothetical protein
LRHATGVSAASGTVLARPALLSCPPISRALQLRPQSASITLPGRATSPPELRRKNAGAGAERQLLGRPQRHLGRPVCRRPAMGKVAPNLRTQLPPLRDGDIDYIDWFMGQAVRQVCDHLKPEFTRHLVQTDRSAYSRILPYVDTTTTWGQVIPNSELTQAEVIHATREETAETSVDVVLRRTGVGQR